MRIPLPYGHGEIEIDIPDERLLAVLEPGEAGRGGSGPEVLQTVLSKPPAAGRFDDFLSAAGDLLVIVNDATRPTPTSLFLDFAADRLDAAGAAFIVATGAHRAPDEKELRYIFGSSLDRFRTRIAVHDARRDPMSLFGTTSRGTEVRLNSRVAAAERLLIIGSVEPHYFAGFTGGRKGLLPGVAAYSSIEQNHSLALSSDSEVLRLSGNPVHEDMAEAGRMVDRNIFTIMTVLDRSQQICAAAAGGLAAAFDEAASVAREVFTAPLSGRADVVIACARHPLDIDLYQAQKAIEHARLALKPGGSLILVSSCRNGIGDGSFVDILSACGGPEDVRGRLAGRYRLGNHKAARLADLCSRSRLLAYTDLEPEALEAVFIEPVSDLQTTIDGLISESFARVVVMPDASVTVPEIR